MKCESCGKEMIFTTKTLQEIAGKSYCVECANAIIAGNVSLCIKCGSKFAFDSNDPEKMHCAKCQDAWTGEQNKLGAIFFLGYALRQIKIRGPPKYYIGIMKGAISEKRGKSGPNHVYVVAYSENEAYEKGLWLAEKKGINIKPVNVDGSIHYKGSKDIMVGQFKPSSAQSLFDSMVSKLEYEDIQMQYWYRAPIKGI